MNGSAKTPSNDSTASSRGPLNRTSLRPTTKTRLSSVGDASQTSGTSGPNFAPENVGQDVLSPPLRELEEDEILQPLAPSVSHASATSMAESSNAQPNARGSSPPKTTSRTISAREVDDLKTKLRVMEKKRMEDREKVKVLEQVQSERDKFEGIIQRLQAKYQPQQQEIADLKKRIKEEEARVQLIEAEQAEHDTAVEMATLDREMAEETADALRTELTSLRQKHEEVVLEVEILREENQELGKEMSPEEKTSQGWLQMERSNERLREALLRLRDITQQQEVDLKSQVAELEKEVQDLSSVREESLNLKESLAQSEAAVEDLQQQLETALGAEEMIEELTDKNMALNQQIEGLKSAIEDLESLKEISDELEMNHTETEKQMQDEIDYGETVLAEQKRRSAAQDLTIQDLEYTVTRFRNLVTNMQNDLEDMRASQQITENEANELTNRSKAMMDLNMKLQTSAAKAQTKAIDVELGKMEAGESAEHLAIIQRFLPETFGIEKNSILAYLRFRRIGFKSNMMHSFIMDKLNGEPLPGHEDSVFAYCEVLDKLTWISNMCERFVSFVQSCSLEAFESIANALFDLEPVERAFTSWIESLKKDELKEKQVADELQRSIALITRLAEIHLPEGLEQYASDIHMRASMLQSHLQGASAALSQIKSMAQHRVPPQIEADNQDEDAETFLRKVDDLISQMRSAKVISSKAIRNIEDLQSRSLTLDQTTLPTVEQAQAVASDLAESSRSTGFSVFKLLNEEGRTTPFTYTEIMLATAPSNMGPFSPLSNKLNSTMTHLQSFSNLTGSLTQVIELPSQSPPPPWQLLAQRLKDAAAASTSREAAYARLKDEMTDKNTALAMREKVVEEMSVKIEVLEKRVGESTGRREQMRDLELAAETSRSKEQDLTAKLKTLQRDLKILEGERDALKKSAAVVPSAAINGSPRSLTEAEPSANTLAQIQNLKSEISTLESTIRYLRHQTYSQHMNSSLAFLSEPLTSPAAPSQSLLQAETRDVLNEMLHIVAQPENQLVKLSIPRKEDRLKWRPARETAAWQLDRMKEEWEGWRDWKNSVSKRGMQKANAVKKGSSLKSEGDILAKLQVNLPGMEKGHPEQVRIVRPDDWEEIEGTVKSGK